MLKWKKETVGMSYLYGKISLPESEELPKALHLYKCNKSKHF